MGGAPAPVLVASKWIHCLRRSWPRVGCADGFVTMSRCRTVRRINMRRPGKAVDTSRHRRRQLGGRPRLQHKTSICVLGHSSTFHARGGTSANFAARRSCGRAGCDVRGLVAVGARRPECSNQLFCSYQDGRSLPNEVRMHDIRGCIAMINTGRTVGWTNAAVRRSVERA